MALPENAAQWSRVTLTTDAPVGAAAVVRLVVERGRVVADDLQLEAGRVPTPFGVRPEERIRLAFEGTPESRLPCWMAEDDTPRKLLVRNGSDAVIDGDLEIWVGPWSQPKSQKLAALKNVSLSAGDAATIPLRLGHLKPDAYVVAAVLARDGKLLLDGSQMVDPSIPIGGSVSGSILKSRAAIRFALGPRVQPAGIFGVGDRHARLRLARLDGELVRRLAACSVRRRHGRRVSFAGADAARTTTRHTFSRRRACPFTAWKASGWSTALRPARRSRCPARKGASTSGIPRAWHW